MGSKLIPKYIETKYEIMLPNEILTKQYQAAANSIVFLAFRHLCQCSVFLLLVSCFPARASASPPTSTVPASKTRRSQDDMAALHRSNRDEHGNWLTVECGYCARALSLEDTARALKHAVSHFTAAQLDPADGSETLCGWNGVCTSKLRSKGAFERHLREAHILPPMVCEGCGEEFTRVSSLDRHRSRGKCVRFPVPCITYCR